MTGNMYSDGYIAIGNVAGNSPQVTESALQVCNFREPIPTQFGLHLGTDSGTWDCGMNICAGYAATNTHIDFSHVGNTTS